LADTRCQRLSRASSWRT